MTTSAGRFTTTSLLARLPRKAWQQLRAGRGTKGDRHYDRAMIEAGPATPRPVMIPGTASCSSAATVTPASSPFTAALHRPAGLADLVAVGCTRWRIDLAVAAAVHRDGHAGQETGLIPITVFLNAWWVTEPISLEHR